MEIIILLLVCGVAFFANLSRHDYIKTEGLRAVVVQEMLAREGFTMPTVHQAPYLKKPPLYAWTVTALARFAGRFDEQIARLPSAVCGTLFVLMLYHLGEMWIGRGGGLAAAVFSLLSPTVQDYAVRAELDLPFSFFCTACLALTLAALPARRGRGVVLWLSAYSFALAACMWKGPHGLIFMWLTMFGYGLLARNWSFLKTPVQWIGLSALLAVLLWWASALGEFAGAASVGRAATIELFVRLVPHRGEHFLRMLLFPLIVFVITVPASVFGAASVLAPLRRAWGGTACAPVVSGTVLRRFRQRIGDWWLGMKCHPLGLRILAWLVPSMLFMTIAPAKSPRYTIPIFAPVFLMGAWMARSFDRAGPGRGGNHATRLWRGIFGVVALGGVIAFAQAAGLTGWNPSDGPVFTRRPYLILGIGCLIPLVADIARKGGCLLQTRLMLMLAVLLAVQPALHGIWWPLRVARDSQREVCTRIDALVPADQRLYVLGGHEYPDTQLYSQRQFEFVDSIDAALHSSGADRAYAILRADEAVDLTAGASVSHSVIFEFERAGKRSVLIEITGRREK